MAKSKSKSNKSVGIKRRVWELQSQCEHDGKEIWTPEIVSSVIAKLEEEKLDNGKPSLKRWAWCMHDKDKVLEENIEQLHLKDPNIQEWGVRTKTWTHMRALKGVIDVFRRAESEGTTYVSSDRIRYRYSAPTRLSKQRTVA